MGLIEWPEVAEGRRVKGGGEGGEGEIAEADRGCVADLSAGWRAEIWVPK
jgi:hypothetical protein